MPRLNEGLEQYKATAGAYGFSGIKMDELGATEYTLVTIIDDDSGSTMYYKDEKEKTIKEIIKACKFSPRADNLLIRLVQFGSSVAEIHGFKPLEHCNLDDYDGICRPKGLTALYDATENGARATAEYGRQLMSNDFDVNAIMFVLTDGWENNSALGINAVKESMINCTKQENVESLVSVLIGVGVEAGDKAELEKFKNEVGFTQFISTKDSSARTLAKIAEFVSKSISSQSQSLGTGGPSQAIQSLAI